MGIAGLDTSHTIFALASGSPPTAVCVLRLSGPRAFEIAEKSFRFSAGPAGEGRGLPRERGVHFGEFVDPDSRAKIDSGLLVTFAVPRSFTGENVVEFQGHGSAVIIQALEQAFIRLGARRAEPGEFAYRAFLNGKLSLPELENLGDVFLAKDFQNLSRVYQRREASLERQIEALRSQLLELQAVMDTAIDFSEEYSAAIHHGQPLLSQVTQACLEITQRYSAFSRGSVVPRAVLAGAPNAGKSSLFNALLGRERVLVSDIPGTTRDAIEEDFEFEGRRWKLVDTAGIREAVSQIEREGIEKGEAYLSASSVWLLVVDGSSGLSASDALLLERFHSKPLIIVWNKKDLSSWEEPPSAIVGSFPVLYVSTFSGEGVIALGEKLNEMAGSLGALEGPLPTESQTSRLAMVHERLLELQDEWNVDTPAEYLAEKIRFASRGLDGVLVPIVADEILGRIFSRFCIGK